MTNILNLKSSSSSHLYASTFMSVLENGDELAPRGKAIREMRPAVIEFMDPRDRITQLDNRKINTFFHAAEVIWMVLGRSDVEFLTKFNKNMATFSDDGVYFNAPYGERVRSWGKHDATGDIHNPLDQLYSVYRMLEADIDTRQAIAVIGNPRYDNADYLLNGGKDVACLVGDTVVSSPEGDLSIKELAEKFDNGMKKYPVFSYNEETETVELKYAVNAWKTKIADETVRITLKDGTVIEATDDHLVYVREQQGYDIHVTETGHKYAVGKGIKVVTRPAGKLKVGDTLCYLNEGTSSNGYKTFSSKSLSRRYNKQKKVHRAYYEFIHGDSFNEKLDVHHKDENKLNNKIENLEQIDPGEHQVLHKIGNTNPAGTSKKRADSVFLTEDYIYNLGLDILSGNGRIRKDDIRDHYRDKGVGYFSVIEKTWGTYQAYKDELHKELGMKEVNPRGGKPASGRKFAEIVKIEVIEGYKDVYDMTVEDNHNFFANGYLVHNCNREMYFKVRDDKLDITVTNRSNDVHWGLFTANLPVFTTFQELVASWIGKDVGTYTQFSDSMHIYTEDYGAKINSDLLESYDKDSLVYKYTFNEPRIKHRSYSEANEMLLKMEDVIERVILNDNTVRQVIELGDDSLDAVLLEIKDVIDDPYFEMLVSLMLVYRVHLNSEEVEGSETDKAKRLDTILVIMNSIPASVWKRSALSFLSKSKKYKDTTIFNKLIKELDESAMVTGDNIEITGGSL